MWMCVCVCVSRSLLYCGVIGLDLQSQIEYESKKLPQFDIVHAITPNQLKLGYPNLDKNAFQQC